MCNTLPGSIDYKVVAFKNGFHGRGYGSLSLTNTNPVHKVAVPAFQWPKLDFPNMKYPWEDNLLENQKEEDRVLEQAKNLFQLDKKIAALIIEPILSEGGDLRASPRF